MKTDTTILIEAMYELSKTIQSNDGVANAAIFEASERLGSQHSDITRLTRQNSAYSTLTKSLEEQLAHLRKNDNECRAAVATLDSERAANARLSAEIDSTNSYRMLLLDLLATIHRDGGNYTVEHGIEKSCEDAGAQVETWISTIEIIDDLCEQAMFAERESCTTILERREQQLDGLSESCSYASEVLRDMARIIRERGSQ